MNFELGFNLSELRRLSTRRLIADFSFVSRPLLEVGVNSEGACNRVNTVNSPIWLSYCVQVFPLYSQRVGLKRGMGNEEMGNGNEEMEMWK